MGNRLSVEIPQQNWTVSDGIITAGQPAVWEAQRRGSKSITATYAEMPGSVNVVVTQGEIAGIIMVINSEEQAVDAQLNLTADEEVRVKIKATDADGNKWSNINVAWTIEHALYNDQSVLQGSPYDSETRFVPERASDSTYRLRATYTDANLSITLNTTCLLYTSPSPRDAHESRMPSSA